MEIRNRWVEPIEEHNEHSRSLLNCFRVKWSGYKDTFLFFMFFWGGKPFLQCSLLSSDIFIKRTWGKFIFHLYIGPRTVINSKVNWDLFLSYFWKSLEQKSSEYMKLQWQFYMCKKRGTACIFLSLSVAFQKFVSYILLTILSRDMVGLPRLSFL